MSPCKNCPKFFHIKLGVGTSVSNLRLRAYQQHCTAPLDIHRALRKCQQTVLLTCQSSFFTLLCQKNVEGSTRPPTAGMSTIVVAFHFFCTFYAHIFTFVVQPIRTFTLWYDPWLTKKYILEKPEYRRGPNVWSRSKGYNVGPTPTQFKFAVTSITSTHEVPNRLGLRPRFKNYTDVLLFMRRTWCHYCHLFI